MINTLLWKLFTDSNTLCTLKNEWEALNNEANNGNLFTSYQWINTWLSIFLKPTWQLNIYAMYDNNKLIAIAPFYLQKPQKWYQPTILYPLGQGEPENAEIASEYCDILIASGYEKAVLTQLSKKLKSLKIDQIIWRATFPDSNISKLLKQAHNYQPISTHARYRIEPAYWPLDALSKNTRSRYKRSLNQLKKIEASFCWIDPQDLKKYFFILSELHQKRWQKKGKTGAFYHSDFKKFHQQLINDNSQENIKMSAIIVEGYPIAIHYYLVDKTTLYFYQSGWNEEHYSNYSLGMALHLWSIQHCEHQYYDFMIGGLNDSYKAKFGCNKIPMMNIVLDLTPWKINLENIVKKIKIFINQNTYKN